MLLIALLIIVNLALLPSINSSTSLQRPFSSSIVPRRALRKIDLALKKLIASL